jgi:prolyl-tRNA synthetase
VRRDTREKNPVPVGAARAAVSAARDAVQSALLAEAAERQAARTMEVSSVADAAEAAQEGFAAVPWDQVGEGGELELAATGATVRCLRRSDGSLATSDDESDLVALIARSY